MPTATCTEPGCSARPYGLNSVLRDPVPTCKAHTPCSEAGCPRMVGKHGCAPAELGRPLCTSHYSRWELYGSTGEHQRKQRADKGSYRIPSRVEDSIAGHPVLSEMFLKNLDIPERGARETSLNANNKCEWRCPNDPSHPAFTAKPNLLMRAGRVVTRKRGDGTTYVYTYPPISCPVCSHAGRAPARRRSLRARLASARPELAAQFVENLTTPGAGPDDVQPRSRDLIQWQCPCGALVSKRPIQVSTGATVLCRTCRRPGESLLEWQVAALVEHATGLTVTKQYRLDGWAVDLHVIEAGASFDLDPYYTHRHPDRVTTDMRKASALLSWNYRRIRETPLKPLTPRDVAVAKGTTAAGFAAAVLTALEAAGHAVAELDQSLVMRALAETRAAWVDKSGDTLPDTHPARADLVVGCVDAPALDWRTTPLRAMLPLRFEVRCSDEAHPTRVVGLRTWLKNDGGCQRCPKNRPVAITVRNPLADVPEARDLFRRLRDYPGVSLANIGRTSQRVGVFACVRCRVDHERPVASWVRGRKLCDACLTVMRKRRWKPE